MFMQASENYMETAAVPIELRLQNVMFSRANLLSQS